MGKPVIEYVVEFDHAVGDVPEINTAIALLLNHLKLELVRTNATKHGVFEYVLRTTE
jgi:hypothetical protein